MEQPTSEKRRKYDRWVTLPISMAAVSSSIIAFSAKGLIDKSALYGSTRVNSLIDVASLIIGAIVLITMWIMLWVSGRDGTRN